MEHVYWVIPDLLAGRPGPDRYPWDLEALHQGGFRAVLSLCEGIAGRGEMRALGLDHLAIPLPASLPPSPEEESSCRRLLPEALYFMRWHILNGLPTLVHCREGQDCTDMVLACYLASYEGMSASEAIDRIRRIAPESLSAPEHVRYVHRLLGISDQAAV
ncbi:MAG: protein-tyrosine phosphatase family protein [Anaerolineae bacterium]|jgi:protein-tyrosine phosphatase